MNSFLIKESFNTASDIFLAHGSCKAYCDNSPIYFKFLSLIEIRSYLNFIPQKSYIFFKMPSIVYLNILTFKTSIKSWFVLKSVIIVYF